MFRVASFRFNGVLQNSIRRGSTSQKSEVMLIGFSFWKEIDITRFMYLTGLLSIFPIWSHINHTANCSLSPFNIYKIPKYKPIELNAKTNCYFIPIYIYNDLNWRHPDSMLWNSLFKSRPIWNNPKRFFFINFHFFL